MPSAADPVKLGQLVEDLYAKKRWLDRVIASLESAVASPDYRLITALTDAFERDGKRAAELAERACALTENKNPGTLDTLAAAYAEGGEFSKAINAAEKAADLALAVGQTAMAGQIASRLELYRAQRPFHE